MSTTSLNELMNKAIAAEQEGVPVNWKELSMTVYNVATNHIANMEKEEPEEENGDGEQLQ